MIGLNSWTTEDRFTNGMLDFEKAFDTSLMNALKTNCLAMELVAIH